MENFNGITGDAISNVVVGPVIQLMKHVLEENHEILEENHEILQTDSTPLENIMLDITAILQDQEELAQETLKIWLQLLHNSLTEAKSILRRYDPPRRQRYLDCVMCNPGRLSKQVEGWKVRFNYFSRGLQRDFSIFVTAPPQIFHKDTIIFMKLMSGEESEADESEESGQPLSEDEESEAEAEADEADEAEDEADEAEADEADESEEWMNQKQKQMNQKQPLSEEEAWMLFRRIAFKDNPVCVDIEQYARNIADECKCLRLPITLVAAAMMGKTAVDEWRTSLSSIKNADPSSPDTDLHQRLIRWSYDALPNSNIKNCFLYCAMYREKERICVDQLVQMWVAEGLVRSRQGSHLMDMAIGFSYVNLLLDRRLFQNARPDEYKSVRDYLQQHIKVHNAIRRMAINIGEEKENCVFKACQRLEIFPEIQNENCKRISVQGNYIEILPTEFTCPKLVSLFLTTTHIRMVPSEFLVSLPSLKVLILAGKGSALSSILSSVGQLKQLEFLDIRGPEIEDLPEDICHLSALQFLDLSNCYELRSLPSKIGELKNLKYLNLDDCDNLGVIPHEISQLTSLSTLSKIGPQQKANIWSLKGLGNLTTLRLRVKVDVQEGRTSSGIKVGIMGTWLEMRHLCLCFIGGSSRSRSRDFVMEDLPGDMQNMKKLQSFIMYGYHGLSLPDYTYKFQHLQYLELCDCPHLRELSPLERLPNLKSLKLIGWPNLKELGIGNSGRAIGFLRLNVLVLKDLPKLESIAGPLNNGVWNEAILPKLCILAIHQCPSLNRLPKGLEKLVSLTSLFGEEDWWESIIWEDENMKTSLQKLFKKWIADLNSQFYMSLLWQSLMLLKLWRQPRVRWMDNDYWI